MFFSVFIVMIFVIFIIKKNYKNRYSFIFSILFVAISIIMSSMLLYINKISVYRSMFRIENELYFQINDVKMSFYDITNLLKATMAILLFSKFLFVKHAYAERKKRIGNWGLILLLAALCIIFYAVNSFRCIEKLHIMQNTGIGTNKTQLVEFLKKLIVVYNIILFVSAMLCPYVVLYVQKKQTRIPFKKKQYRVICSIIFVLDIILMTIIFAGQLLNIFTLNFKPQSIFIAKKWHIYFFTALPFVVFSVLAAVYIILVKYNILDGFAILFKREITKRIKIMPYDIKNAAHSLKNSFFSINILGEKLKNNYGSDDGRPLIDSIIDISDDAMRQVENILNVSSDVIMNIGKYHINECVEAAAARVKNSNVEIVLNGGDPKVCILCNFAMLTESLANIMINSVEAIKNSGKDDGLMVINVCNDSEHVCISVWDNGCGIAKANIKKIFKPFFSTKNSYKNWGIGLSYTSDSINAHGGIIIVDSKENEYTQFEVLLPVYKGK